MELVLRSTNRRKFKNVERNHQWYDHVNKQMLHGKGGRMEFRYDPIRKRSIPYIVEHKEWVYESDYPEILDWVKKNNRKYDYTILYDDRTKNITLNVDAKQFEDIQEDLYRNKIVSDWSEGELKKELRNES